MLTVDQRPVETVNGSNPETVLGTNVPDRFVNQENIELAVRMFLGEFVKILSCSPR